MKNNNFLSALSAIGSGIITTLLGGFRTCTALFFAFNEALSIVENVGKVGVKIPDFLRRMLTKLKDENAKKAASLTGSTPQTKEKKPNG